MRFRFSFSLQTQQESENGPPTRFHSSDYNPFLGALIPNALTSRHEPARAKSDVLIVENDAKNGVADQTGEASAKMGKEAGTHTGSKQATQPESDTQKIDQPPRSNVPEQ